MGKLVQAHWHADSQALEPQGRMDVAFEAYAPDPLVGRRFAFDGATVAAMAEAERAISELNSTAHALADTEALARLLLRAESVGSSRIEGLRVGARKLLRAEAAQEETPRISPYPTVAQEVLNNIEAMAWAIGQVEPGQTWAWRTVLDAHEKLLAGTNLEKYAGRVRQMQNWIGGDNSTPAQAEFVPPPPELLPNLIEDLVAFCNADTLPPVAQAAIAHAQFETIHPFVDGNGRIGRALIHMILRQRNLAVRAVLPVSLVLATHAKNYVQGLTHTRFVGHPDDPQAQLGLNDWIALFARACTRAVQDARRFEERAAAIEQQWRDKLGRVRAKSAMDILLRKLVGAPVLTTSSAAQLIGRSFQQTNEAIERCVQAGILKQVNTGKRNRAFEAAEIVDAFTTLERGLATTTGDTRTELPVRAVPQRPKK